jgi:hypothetical protein
VPFKCLRHSSATVRCFRPPYGRAQPLTQIAHKISIGSQVSSHLTLQELYSELSKRHVVAGYRSSSRHHSGCIVRHPPQPFCISPLSTEIPTCEVRLAMDEALCGAYLKHHRIHMLSRGWPPSLGAHYHPQEVTRSHLNVRPMQMLKPVSSKFVVCLPVLLPVGRWV